VEAAMGLTVGGFTEAARNAYAWSAGKQLPDGAWYAAYRNGVVEDKTRDANFTAYIAVGVYHYYLATADRTFIRGIWKTVKRAVDFTLSLQAETGEIHWALDPAGKVDRRALVTGSSSIYNSIKCAVALAKLLGVDAGEWRAAGDKLKGALCFLPERFDNTKSRYAMDWFYPVLSGVYRGDAAIGRIEKGWNRFVVEGHGVCCVSDAPWVTIAETAELVLALTAVGEVSLGRTVFDWITDKVYENGSYWYGYNYRSGEIWPPETTTWTDAVVLLAADALFQTTPAARLFNHRRTPVEISL
jgi:hypothetical protein